MSSLIRAARVNRVDRQRALDDLCRRALKEFVGRDATPTMIAEVEAKMRAVLDEAIRAGTYVLPDGLVLSRVEVGSDMRIKVFFAPAPTKDDVPTS